MNDDGNAPGSDLQAVLDRHLSVTPLQLDMTDRGALEEVMAPFAG